MCIEYCIQVNMYRVSTQDIDERLINVHYYYYYVMAFVQGQLLPLLGNHSGAHQAEVHQPAGKRVTLGMNDWSWRCAAGVSLLGFGVVTLIFGLIVLTGKCVLSFEIGIMVSLFGVGIVMAFLGSKYCDSII